MSVRTTPPTLATEATTQKLARKLDAQKTTEVFWVVMGAIWAVHFLVVVAVMRQGLGGYLSGWVTALAFLMAHPGAAVVLFVAVIMVYQGVVHWRQPDDEVQTYGPFPPLPDLRFTNAIHIGSGWTVTGKQPGDLIEPNDEAADTPHVILQEKGLFGNLHCKGGTGGGKTSTLILPFIEQAIGKYPIPPDPDGFPLGPDGRVAATVVAPPLTSLHHLRRRLRGRLGFPVTPEAPEVPAAWNPYAGMTPAEARAEHGRLSEEHRTKKWGLFLVDPKGDITAMVQRMAARVGRADDVIVLRPDGSYTYNPLLIAANPLVQSEMVMDGIEAVSGEAIQQYYRQTMSEWLANALTILRVVDPTRITFKNLLRMARSETLRSSMVSEAKAIMQQCREEEERHKRLGRPYTGLRVNPAAIEFFEDWDDADSDPQRKQAVVSGLKAQAKYFVDDELAPFLCPEMPPTFGGFEQMIDVGQIVIFRMPLDIYGPVAKVSGILMLADAQQAARARINRPDINQDRVVAFIVDEIANYLNRLTKEFISMNRQSRVTFLGAHQSQGQLIQRGDKGFETSFNDNLRTKISYNAPNAEAGRREAAIFGSRMVWQESVSESQNFSKVEQQADQIEFVPVGGQSQGQTRRIEEVERPWFDAEAFVSLKTGEMIVREFDGTTTLTPREIKALGLYERPEYASLMAMDMPDGMAAPHPVVVVEPGTRDHEYLNAAFSQTGFVLCEPLANHAGDLEGFKFITSVGTLVVSCVVLDQIRDTLVERMTEPQILVVFTDLINCSTYFCQDLGLQMERVVDLLDIYTQALPDTQGQVATFGDVFQAEMGRPLQYPLAGSWEYHLDLKANRRTLLADSLDAIRIFSKLGEALFQLDDEALEQIYERARHRIQEALATPIGAELAIPDADEPPPPAGEDGLANALAEVLAGSPADGPMDDHPFGPAFDEDFVPPDEAPPVPTDEAGTLEAAVASDRVDGPVDPETPAAPLPSTLAVALPPSELPALHPSRPPRRLARAARGGPAGDRTLFEMFERPSPLRDTSLGASDDDDGVTPIAPIASVPSPAAPKPPGKKRGRKPKVRPVDPEAQSLDFGAVPDRSSATDTPPVDLAPPADAEF